MARPVLPDAVSYRRFKAGKKIITTTDPESSNSSRGGVLAASSRPLYPLRLRAAGGVVVDVSGGAPDSVPERCDVGKRSERSNG